MKYVDLVFDGGELVRIECPDEYEDAFYDSLENAMKRHDWWCPSQFNGCTATYLGLMMDRVNMNKVVGML